MMTQDKVTKSSDAGRNVWDEDQVKKSVTAKYEPSYGERWNQTRPTKTVVFGIVVAAMILTMIIGFNWGGWVTGGTAQKMTADVITQRLSLICVGQFSQDPQRDQKLTTLKDTGSYQRDDYVREQGWATMPGEVKPDTKVADSCAKLIVQGVQ